MMMRHANVHSFCVLYTGAWPINFHKTRLELTPINGYEHKPTTKTDQL